MCKKEKSILLNFKGLGDSCLYELEKGPSREYIFMNHIGAFSLCVRSLRNDQELGRPFSFFQAIADTSHMAHRKMWKGSRITRCEEL